MSTPAPIIPPAVPEAQAEPTPPQALSVHIDRAGREIFLLDEGGQVVAREPVGIGRGGLKRKQSMADLVTPTGVFTVDLILSEDGANNTVAPSSAERFRGTERFAALLEGPAALRQLFRNMNGIDFDGDGAPDRAYGSAYIGLDAADAVTGPKMRDYHGTPYWFSIALHGTPDPSNLGAANSGGCVHLSPDMLERLIQTPVLTPGSQVVIQDGPPSSPSL